MLSNIFFVLLRMNIVATFVAIIVLATKTILKKLGAPRKVLFCLWIVIAARLVFPFMIESDFSLFNFIPERINSTYMKNINELNNNGNINFIPVNDDLDPEMSSNDNINTNNNGLLTNDTNNDRVIENQNAINPEKNLLEEENSNVKRVSFLDFLMIAWLIGSICMILYFIGSYINLKNRLKFAIKIDENCFETDMLTSSCIVGIVKPKIYLTSNISDNEKKYILAHENIHLKRKDYVLKLIAYLILSIHWVNPFNWLLYKMFLNDMEMLCDEETINQIGEKEKENYMKTLLNISSQNRNKAIFDPVSFNKISVEKRIKNMISYKKCKIAIIIFAAIVLLILIPSCLTDKNENARLEKIIKEEYKEAENLSSDELLNLANCTGRIILREDLGNNTFLGYLISEAQVEIEDGERIVNRESAIEYGENALQKIYYIKINSNEASLKRYIEGNEYDWSFYRKEDQDVLYVPYFYVTNSYEVDINYLKQELKVINQIDDKYKKPKSIIRRYQQKDSIDFYEEELKGNKYNTILYYANLIHKNFVKLYQQGEEILKEEYDNILNENNNNLEFCYDDTTITLFDIGDSDYEVEAVVSYNNKYYKIEFGIFDEWYLNMTFYALNLFDNNLYSPYAEDENLSYEELENLCDKTGYFIIRDEISENIFLAYLLQVNYLSEPINENGVYKKIIKTEDYSNTAFDKLYVLKLNSNMSNYNPRGINVGDDWSIPFYQLENDDTIYVPIPVTEKPTYAVGISFYRPKELQIIDDKNHEAWKGTLPNSIKYKYYYSDAEDNELHEEAFENEAFATILYQAQQIHSDFENLYKYANEIDKAEYDNQIKANDKIIEFDYDDNVINLFALDDKSKDCAGVIMHENRYYKVDKNIIDKWKLSLVFAAKTLFSAS